MMFNVCLKSHKMTLISNSSTKHISTVAYLKSQYIDLFFGEAVFYLILPYKSIRPSIWQPLCSMVNTEDGSIVMTKNGSYMA